MFLSYILCHAVKVVSNDSDVFAAYLQTVPNLAGQSRFFTMFLTSRITQKMSRILLLVPIFTKTKPYYCIKFIILDFST